MVIIFLNRDVGCSVLFSVLSCGRLPRSSVSAVKYSSKYYPSHAYPSASAVIKSAVKGRVEVFGQLELPI